MSKPAFIFYRRPQGDILLMTTYDTPTILNLIEIFELGDEVAKDILVLLGVKDARNKTALVSIARLFEKNPHYAYTAFLECDLCGVKSGYFTVFSSLSGDTKALTEESQSMFEFLNARIEQDNRFEEVVAGLPVNDYLN